MHNLTQTDFDCILSFKDILVNNSKKLTVLDPHDHYWKYLSDEALLTREGMFLESNMVSSWIGANKKPKRILEIGTRTGGSLIALLCVYKPDEFQKIEKILCFDMWREYVSTTPLASFVSKLFNKKSNINISQRFTKFLGKSIEKKSTNKVRNNLKEFNIPSDKISFISGDSKIKVPEFFAAHPEEKFDYILVDGGHDELTAERDLDNVANYVLPGGVILFDDIMPESYNLIGVWNKFKEKHKDQFSFFEIHHRKGIAWAIKK